MADLKKYTSFEALKAEEKLRNDLPKDSFFSEFEAFLKQLRSEYVNKKKPLTDNGKQPGR
jgi:hypothetical protein